MVDKKLSLAEIYAGYGFPKVSFVDKFDAENVIFSESVDGVSSDKLFYTIFKKHY